jgi:hypothetical protein
MISRLVKLTFLWALFVPATPAVRITETSCNTGSILQGTQSTASTLHLLMNTTQCSLQETQYSYPLEQQLSSPVITAKYIKKHISKYKKNPKLAALFNQILESDPYVRHYMEFVLTHLIGFKILFYSSEDFEIAGIPYSGIYFPSIRAIIFRSDIIENNTPGVLEGIRHEMRHAAMHTVQLLLTETETCSPEIYIKDDRLTHNTILEMIEKGDRRVDEVNELLQKEASKKHLSQKENKYLKRLRKASIALYHSHYKSEFIEVLPIKLIKHPKLHQKFAIGEIYNIDAMRKSGSQGDLKITKISPSPDLSDEVEVTSIYQDPLHAIVRSILITKDHTKKAYAQEEYAYERDAYLHGKTPPVLIKAWYPELYAYTNQVITFAKNIPSYYHDVQLPEWSHDIQSMMLQTVLASLNTPCFQALYTGRKNEKKSFTREMLNSFIQQDRFVGEASLALAKLEYQEKNYKMAATFFKRALKKKATLSNSDYENYLHSAARVKRTQ